MNAKKAVGAFLSFLLAFCSLSASADAQQTESAAAAKSADLFSAASFDNPFNKQDDKEVLYDKRLWVQPPEWNCPTVNPKNYPGYIMIYFDKIGLEPDKTGGKVQRVYCSIHGTTEPVSMMKFHIYYDTRLTVKPNADGGFVTPGKNFGSFTTGSAMIEEGQLVYYAVSEDTMLEDSCLFTIDFILPENPQPGDVYPIGLAYTDDGIAHDTFFNSAGDEAAKLQMTYVFLEGIYNGWISMAGAKQTTAPPPEPLLGDVNGDGTVTLADAVLLFRIIAEEYGEDMTLTEQSFTAADYDGDNRIALQDAAKLLAYLKAQPAE